jgi:hypothetical protein
MKKLLFLLPFVLFSCGIYTFSGSSIPTHMKTIELPLFENNALVQGVAEDITDKLTLAVQREKLKLVPRDGDAIITGTVATYQNKAYDYSGNRDNISIKTYAVYITAKVAFRDQVDEKDLYNGVVSAEGVYDFNTEDEEVGRKRAVDDLVEKIMINSLQGW